MKFLIGLLIFTAFNLINANLNVVSQQNIQNLQLPNDGIAVDEVVVESSLYIKPKQSPQIRRTRRSIVGDLNNLKSLIEHKRVKRQLEKLEATTNTQNTQLPNNGITVDEVVVESSLYIKPKQSPQLRRNRRSLNNNVNNLIALLEHKRVKRQFGQSQAAANAAAQQNYNNLYGFGNSAANAQAQAFNAQGPSGSFGASSAGTLTQALNANRFGVQNSAGASHALNFNLPNGQSINFASTNSFANGPNGNNANSRGSAVSVNRI